MTQLALALDLDAPEPEADPTLAVCAECGRVVLTGHRCAGLFDINERRLHRFTSIIWWSFRRRLARAHATG